jgi:hypothetical protein
MNEDYYFDRMLYEHDREREENELIARLADSDSVWDFVWDDDVPFHKIERFYRIKRYAESLRKHQQGDECDLQSRDCQTED